VPEADQFAGDAGAADTGNTVIDSQVGDTTAPSPGDGKATPADVDSPKDVNPPDAKAADIVQADAPTADVPAKDAGPLPDGCGCASDGDCNMATAVCQKAICDKCICKVVLAPDGTGCNQDEVCKQGKCVPAPSKGPWAKTLVVGGDHNCVIRPDSSAWCWGRNESGQLGVGDTKLVVGAKAVVDLGKANALAAGHGHTCALVQGGQVYCWGDRFYGQTGAANKSGNATKPEAAKGITDGLGISAGDHNSQAVRKGQTLWAWGSNSGDLAQIGKYTSVTTPVQVVPVLDVKLSCAGVEHACVLHSTGKVTCWGRNTWGQLGFGKSNYSSPAVAPGQVKGLPTMAGITCGHWHTCAWSAAGKAFCWGKNLSGQAGTGSKDPDAIDAATQVTWLQDAKVVAAGQGHTCAVRTSGEVLCWGGNSAGETGLPPPKSTANHHVIDMGAKAVSVGAGEDHSCALREDGSVWCWGENLHGQLGDGTKNNTHKPVAVQGSLQK